MFQIIPLPIKRTSSKQKPAKLSFGGQLLEWKYGEGGVAPAQSDSSLLGLSMYGTHIDSWLILFQ